MPTAARLGRRRDADVRKLLRLLRRPHLLEKERLAILLRQAVGCENAREALATVIDQTFGSSYDDQRLREIVQRCDVRGEKARFAAAAMHLSLRQFFRYRVEAIGAVASQIGSRLDGTSSPDHDLALARMLSAGDAGAALAIYASVAQAGPQALPPGAREDAVRCAVWADAAGVEKDLVAGDARLALIALAEHAGLALLSDAAAVEPSFARAKLALAEAQGVSAEPALFALTAYAVLRARIEGRLQFAATLCAELLELGGSNECLHALALAEQAYQACLDGRPSHADSLLYDAERLAVLNPHLAVSGRVALAKAATFYLAGNHAEALCYASAAVSGLSGTFPGHAFVAAALAGRAALVAGKAWVAPDALCERYPNASLRAAVEAVRSRHLLRNDLGAAKRAAMHALRLAEKYGARAGVALAHASLSAVAEAQHRAVEARALRAQAWREALAVGDHLLLADGFPLSASIVAQLPPITA